MPQEAAGWFQGTIDVVRKFIWVLKFVSMETHYLLS
ncbi:hypothetical protein BDA96_01G400200 [Sorghum bicolor]|uniref:Uncharacterized protein n=2 Tax=Sorghum bicolor TaxID=4558 RepID=A0A921UEC4_SORBI|nr:hypothetical protein BDA96_06G273500 [Sorghum bicolor]KAG0551172.1 hypothetical protein BDA96_01G400200 [Sorghum bicolor]OQU92615.1 hypothetical protein SORBI_3001G376266 [Sorghum bicolor]